ncbi:glycosyltransferase family 2 protein [Candidatus Latescibacterota bacterium]
MSEKKVNNIKLTIAIPTFNGALRIQETLDSIINQISIANEKVEIVISDNASTDKTPQIVKSYQEVYPFIKYFCNDENLGVDCNFDLAIQRASGEYVWFFGDDDKMAPGGIQKVLMVLGQNSDISNIFVNCKMMDSTFTQCYEERVIHIYEDLLLKRADDFLLQIGPTATLVPAIVVRRSLWLKVDNIQLFGTEWLVLIMIFSIMPGHTAYIISKPYSLFNSGSQRWHKKGHFLKMILKLCSLLPLLIEYGYTQSAVNKTIKKLTCNPTFLIFNAKRNGLNVDIQLIKDVCKIFGRSTYFWIFGFPLLLLPKIIHDYTWEFYQIPLIKRTYQKIKSHTFAKVSSK